MKSLVLITLFAAISFAQDAPPDAEGCKDSPLVARFPGSHINSCDHKEFESVQMPVAKDKDGNEVDKAIEGEYFYYDMATRDGVSNIQLFRNFQNALTAAGYKIIFAGSPEKVTAQKGPQYIGMEFKETYYLTTIKQQAMKQEATADATALGNEIDQSGHVLCARRSGLRFRVNPIPSGRRRPRAAADQS